MLSPSRPTLPVLLLAGLLAVAGPVRAAPGGEAPATPHKAKQALDDRADPNALRGSEVGKGSHMGRKATQPGAYFGDAARSAVQKYYAEHPAPAGGVPWEVGGTLPQGAAAGKAPGAILAHLPKVPPGTRYVQVAGDILLVAASGMVVDGISARPR